MANRLAGALSPYLLQHAENPVDWWEWCDDAFAEAVRREVPVLLSVGYAACHWCHVMAHESFEDATVAAYLNDHFVAIKVDREERPDVDAVYMSVTQALTGSGGWPMTVFLTPHRKPFYAGTYYPPEPRHGMPSFPQILAVIADAWRDRREDVLGSAQRITDAVNEAGTPGEVVGFDPVVGARLAEDAVGTLSAEFDVANGGFGRAPKFPPAMVLLFLLRQHVHTGDPRALVMAEATAEAMARGGLYDQLEGGFCRYSVDSRWVVPHFEKMLYDNALLLRAYTSLWCVTRSELAERVATGTAEFLIRDLRTDGGAFASSLDADTDGIEGYTYVWTPGQLDAVLGGDDARFAAEAFEVTEAGTFEHGASVLQRLREPEDPQRLERIRAVMRESRSKRPQPGRDDKVVTAWNGLAIAALAEAGAVFDRPAWLDAATRAGEAIAANVANGQLRRVSRDGVVGLAGATLEDHADLAEGLLALYQAGGDAKWLRPAARLLDTAVGDYRDADGTVYDTAADAEVLIARPREAADNATPAGWSALAGALLTHAALTGREDHREIAGTLLSTQLTGLPPRFAGWGLAVLVAALDGPREIAIVGPPGTARDALVRQARRSGAPGAVVVAGSPDAPGFALLGGRVAIGEKATAYVCKRFVCDRPVLTPEELAGLLVDQPAANTVAGKT